MDILKYLNELVKSLALMSPSPAMKDARAERVQIRNDKRRKKAELKILKIDKKIANFKEKKL